MDDSLFSSLRHYAWFGFSMSGQAAAPIVVERRATNHSLVLSTAGAVDCRWARRGHETTLRHAVDQIAFYPCDNAIHTYDTRPATALSSCYVLQIPETHLSDIVERDEGGMPSECGYFLPREDSVLRDCMIRLRGKDGHGVACDIGSEIAARRLVLRLSELLGGKNPDWHNDINGFSAPDMKQIVEYIDSRLSHQFCLEQLSSLVGYSPSHFAKKFRNTEGISVGRFINRRRVAAAMIVLQNDSVTLTEIALNLGFSSHSHFTRLFSELVGTPPARFRSLFKPVVHYCAQAATPSPPVALPSGS